MDAAQRGQKASSVPPFPFSLPDVRFAPACAPLPFHAPNGQRCRVTVPAALQARRPPFRTARDISARSTNRRTSGRIAFVVCVYCLSPPTCSEKGLRRSPRNPSAQKAVKSDSLDNKHRNAVPNVKILLKTHSKQSKKRQKAIPSTTSAETSYRTTEARSEWRSKPSGICLRSQNRCAKTKHTKSRKPLIEQPFGFLRPTEKCVVVRNASFMPPLTGSAFCAARFRTDEGSQCGACQPFADHAPRLGLHLAGRRAGEVTLCSRVLDRRRIVVRRSRGIPAFIRRSCVCCIRRNAVRPAKRPSERLHMDRESCEPPASRKAHSLILRIQARQLQGLSRANPAYAHPLRAFEPAHRAADDFAAALARILHPFVRRSGIRSSASFRLYPLPPPYREAPPNSRNGRAHTWRPPDLHSCSRCFQSRIARASFAL